MNLLKRASYKEGHGQELVWLISFFFFNWVAEIVFLACHLVTVFMAKDYVGFNHMDSKLEKNVVIAVLCLRR